MTKQLEEVRLFQTWDDCYLLTLDEFVSSRIWEYKKSAHRAPSEKWVEAVREVWKSMMPKLYRIKEPK